MCSIRFLSVISLVLTCTRVYGWASFKHLSREKREWLETIAVKHGLHVERHIREMQALSRVKRATYSGCGGGGGGGGGSTGGGGFGGGGFSGIRGGSGGITVLDTVVVRANRIPEPVVNFPRLFPRFPTRGFGGGGGGAPPPPPPAEEKPQEQPPQEPPEDKDAKKMTYEQFVYQLENLEKLFPDLPPDQMAHKLRMLVSRYDSTLWKLMLNVNANPIPGLGKEVSPFSPTSGNKAMFDQLKTMADHRFQNGAELGVIKINGETVALGHVITGATAGYDPNTLVGMDNLFATTISGDLGQAGLANNRDATSPVIGPKGTWTDGKYVLTGKGGFATHAEILGDIDGFNIGKRIRTDPTKPLSQHFREYYTGGESQKRFDVFTQHTTKEQLRSEVYRFANLYDYKEAGLLSSVLQNMSADLAVRRAQDIDRIANTAVNTFCTRFSTQLGTWCN